MIGLILLLVVINLIVNFSVGLARYWLGTIVMFFIFITLPKTRNTMAVCAGIWLVVLLVAYPIAFDFRDATNLNDLPKVISIENPIDYFNSGDHDAIC